jgi:hypothetical protein
MRGATEAELLQNRRVEARTDEEMTDENALVHKSSDETQRLAESWYKSDNNARHTSYY